MGTRNALSDAMQNKAKYSHVILKDGTVVSRDGTVLGIHPNRKTKNLDMGKVLDVKSFIDHHEQQAMRIAFLQRQRHFGTDYGPVNEMEELVSFNTLVPVICEEHLVA